VAKVGHHNVIHRKFKKEASVFAHWMEDSGTTLELCLESQDFMKWKVPKFVKNEDDIKPIKKFFRKNFKELKDLYANLQAESSGYPGVS